MEALESKYIAARSNGMWVCGDPAAAAAALGEARHGICRGVRGCGGWSCGGAW
jgi:alkyl hydroperoxide reductase subunit AhpF